MNHFVTAGGHDGLTGLGFSLTDAQRARELGEGKAPTKKYLGYILAVVKNIKNLAIPGARFDLYHDPENGIQSHCTIQYVDECQENKKSRKNFAAQKLKEQFSDLRTP